MIKVAKCSDEYLERRLQSIEKRGGVVISVTWRSVPYSEYTVVYREAV